MGRKSQTKQRHSYKHIFNQRFVSRILRNHKNAINRKCLLIRWKLKHLLGDFCLSQRDLNITYAHEKFLAAIISRWKNKLALSTDSMAHLSDWLLKCKQEQNLSSAKCRQATEPWGFHLGLISMISAMHFLRNRNVRWGGISLKKLLGLSVLGFIYQLLMYLSVHLPIFEWLWRISWFPILETAQTSSIR